jgi:4'-phosphopantetheinyl transferase EntD
MPNSGATGREARIGPWLARRCQVDFEFSGVHVVVRGNVRRTELDRLAIVAGKTGYDPAPRVALEPEENPAAAPSVMSARPSKHEPTSTPLAGLFPPGTIGFEVEPPVEAASLFPEELESIRHAVPKRVGEFAAGRACARQALAGLGYRRVPLPAGPDRRPVWPNGIVGSISHTDGFCVAVAARAGCVTAIGIDVERTGRIEERIWKSICTPEELSWLRRRPPGDQPILATILFSAKESFFKCQFGSTGLRPDFTEVAIEVIAHRGFRVQGRRSGLESIAARVQGAIAVRGNLVVTGSYIPAKTADLRPTSISRRQKT